MSIRAIQSAYCRPHQRPNGASTCDACVVVTRLDMVKAVITDGLARPGMVWRE
jgi:hypothetical protein